MTEQYPPQQPPGGLHSGSANVPTEAHPVTPFDPKKRRRWVPWVAYPATLFLGVAIGAGVGGTATTASTTPGPTVTVTETAPPASAAPASASTTAPTYDTPQPKDFKLTVKTRKKECFGSAGCLVTYQVDATWTKTFDPSITYELIYVVRGDEDGPAFNIMTITGDEFTHATEETASTPSSKTKLTATTSSVEEK